MTIKECYDACGGNFEEVLGRFRSERLVVRFAGKFLADPSYAALKTSLEEKNYEEAFRAAHTLKGVCQNLGLTRLHLSSDRLTEVLRPGHEAERDAADVEKLFRTVTADYELAVDAIGKLDS